MGTSGCWRGWGGDWGATPPYTSSVWTEPTSEGTPLVLRVCFGWRGRGGEITGRVDEGRPTVGRGGDLNLRDVAEEDAEWLSASDFLLGLRILVHGAVGELSGVLDQRDFGSSAIYSWELLRSSWGWWSAKSLVVDCSSGFPMFLSSVGFSCCPFLPRRVAILPNQAVCLFSSCGMNGGGALRGISFSFAAAMNPFLCSS